MPLLTDELRKRLPLIGATESEEDPMVICKFFTPWTNWTWYVIEFDQADTFFGLVDGHEVELGYFSLQELQTKQGPYGLRIERDRYFKPERLSVIRERIEGR
jgi:hypothetical protein